MGFYEAKRNAIFIFLINEFRFPLTRQTFVAFFRRPTRLNSFMRLARCRRPRRARREAITKQCEPSIISSFVWPAAGARREAPRRARREAITKQCEPSLIPRVSSHLQAPAGRPPGGPAGRPSQNNVNLALFLVCLARCKRPPGGPPEGPPGGHHKTMIT